MTSTVNRPENQVRLTIVSYSMLPTEYLLYINKEFNTSDSSGPSSVLVQYIDPSRKEDQCPSVEEGYRSVPPLSFV